MVDRTPEEKHTMAVGKHWLACPPGVPPGDSPYRQWKVMDAGDMDRLQSLGWLVEGPFMPVAEVERLCEKYEKDTGRQAKIVADQRVEVERLQEALRKIANDSLRDSEYLRGIALEALDG